MKSWQSTTALYSYQQQAVDHLRVPRFGALFMEMGTGKTRTAIELLKLRQHKISRVIWFCPVSAKETLRHQLQTHTDCDPANIYVFDHKTRPYRLPAAWWYIVGTESMSSSNRVVLSVASLIDDHACVVVDESSAIKTYWALRTERITLLAERARYRLVLTGTPLSQGLQDLYAQMRFLHPDILGYRSFYSFAHQHLIYSEKYPGVVIKTRHTDVVAAKVAPYVFQIKKAECLELPEKLYTQRRMSMTPAQEQAYRQAKEEILLSCEPDEIDSVTIFRLFTALQQIVCGYWARRMPNSTITLQTYPHKRLELLGATLGEIDASAKVLIWSKYRRCLSSIVELLTQKYGVHAVSQFHGGLTETKRNAELDRFRHDARFLVATPSCGGYALTLNEATHVVFYTNGFKYADRLQAEDRCHRVGQTNKVTYIDLVCSQSIDERIRESHCRKESFIQSFQREVKSVKHRAQVTRLLDAI